MQATNGKKRSVVLYGIIYNSIADAARQTGINYQTLQSRIQRGKNAEYDYVI
jgi:hypothetical protein